MTKIPITAASLNLNPSSGDEEDLFCWLIASFLCGKRIQQEVAVSAYHAIVGTQRINSVEKMAAYSHRQLVTMLGEGRYVRYDESTATRLTALCRKLIDHYDGQVSELVQRSLDSKDLARRLQEFEGIGPKTSEIFMREVLAIE
jgi:endonuclease III